MTIPLTTFQLFPSLPIELRLQIWAHAAKIYPPRVLELHLLTRPSRSQSQAQAQSSSISPPTPPAPLKEHAQIISISPKAERYAGIPAIFSVSREARTEALNVYLPGPTLCLKADEGHRQAWFCPLRETVYRTQSFLIADDDNDEDDDDAGGECGVGREKEVRRMSVPCWPKRGEGFVLVTSLAKRLSLLSLPDLDSSPNSTSNMVPNQSSQSFQRRDSGKWDCSSHASSSSSSSCPSTIPPQPATTDELLRIARRKHHLARSDIPLEKLTPLHGFEETVFWLHALEMARSFQERLGIFRRNHVAVVGNGGRESGEDGIVEGGLVGLNCEAAKGVVGELEIGGMERIEGGMGMEMGERQVMIVRRFE